MPQRSIVRKRKKARRTKQLAEWREKQEQKAASAGAGSARLITGGALEDGAAEADAPPATFG